MYCPIKSKCSWDFFALYFSLNTLLCCIFFLPMLFSCDVFFMTGIFPMLHFSYQCCILCCIFHARYFSYAAFFLASDIFLIYIIFMPVIFFLVFLSSFYTAHKKKIANIQKCKLFSKFLIFLLK